MTRGQRACARRGGCGGGTPRCRRPRCSQDKTSVHGRAWRGPRGGSWRGKREGKRRTASCRHRRRTAHTSTCTTHGGGESESESEKVMQELTGAVGSSTWNVGMKPREFVALTERHKLVSIRTRICSCDDPNQIGSLLHAARRAACLPERTKPSRCAIEPGAAMAAGCRLLSAAGLRHWHGEPGTRARTHGH